MVCRDCDSPYHRRCAPSPAERSWGHSASVLAAYRILHQRVTQQHPSEYLDALAVTTAARVLRSEP